MKSQIEVIEINNSRMRMEKERRDITKEERLKIQKKKREKAKRQRRLQMIRFWKKIALVLAIVLLGRFAVVKAMKMTSTETKNIEVVDEEVPQIETVDGEMSSNLKTSQFPQTKNNEVMGYNVGTPQVLESHEIKDRLRNLSEQYSEFTEIYENMDAYPETLMSSLCNNPEMIDFVKGYLTAGGSVTGGVTKEELSENFPLFLQWDTRWGYYSYGESNIALSGCAPACLAMVIVGLTGDESATPDAVADYSMSNGYYASGTGTMWSLMTEGGGAFGVQGEELGCDKNVIYSNLEEGNPIICSMNPGDFTTAGHFILLTGIEDGKIKINDPNCIERSSKLWEFETLEYQIKNLWVFTQN